MYIVTPVHLYLLRATLIEITCITTEICEVFLWSFILSTENPIYEFSDCGFLNCDTVQFCRLVATFRRNILPPSGESKWSQPEAGSALFFRNLLSNLQDCRRDRTPADHKLKDRCIAELHNLHTVKFSRFPQVRELVSKALGVLFGLIKTPVIAEWVASRTVCFPTGKVAGIGDLKATKPIWTCRTREISLSRIQTWSSNADP